MVYCLILLNAWPYYTLKTKMLKLNQKWSPVLQLRPAQIQQGILVEFHSSHIQIQRVFILILTQAAIVVMFFQVTGPGIEP